MLYGNYTHLPPSVTKRLKKLENRKSQPDWVISPELARSLWEISEETGRQMGLLIDRQGAVQGVVAGDPQEITIPVLARFRALPGRLRGLRFIRTSLTGAEPDTDDIADLAMLRLDSLSILTGREQIPTHIHTIHLMPPSPENSGQFIPYESIENTDPHKSPYDYKEFIEKLEAEIASKTQALYEVKRKHAAILVGAFTSRQGIGEHMAELSELADSAGFDILGMITQIRNTPHPRTVVGAGKLSEIIITALIKGADTIIFDNSLTPAQVKTVTSFAEINIMDRTQLILEIFGQRAMSNEGKIRVELARLKYFMPYLTGRDDSLSRITGGIDGKGPGETKLELDRRRIADRITFLSNKLKKIERTRTTQRSKRRRHELPVISIIGYTNAGKSTLLNNLTKANVYADDRLFATLDTSSKRIRFPQEKDVIITDTVGFIRDLPEDLAGAFKSTLEELEEADLLLHVVDASSIYAEQHIKSVNAILKEMNLHEKPKIIVFNKIDSVSDDTIEMLREQEEDAVFISAIQRHTLISLIDRLNYELFKSNNFHFGFQPEKGGL